jgi:tape measure domain-containing protein
MTDIVTGIKLKGDASGLVGESKRAREELGKFGPAVTGAGEKAQRSSTRITAMSAATGNLTSSLRSMFSPVNLLTGGIAALVASMGISQVVRFSDEMKQLDNQLKLITETDKERLNIQTQLLRLSNSTYSDLGSTTQLYARMHRATKDLKIGQEQLLAVTRAVNQSYVISGASTAEAAGSTRQLAQALASGAFRGDEFNSVAEQAPRLMEALGKELGKSTGELREMAENGELTSSKLISALINQSAAIDREFGKMAPTASQAMTVVGNNFKTLVAEVNSASGDFGGLTELILGVGDALDTVTKMVANGEIVTYLSAYAGAWSGWSDSIFNAIDAASTAVNQFPLQVLAAKAIVEETLNFLGDAFKYLPQNVYAMVQAIAVEMAHLDRIKNLYIRRFRELIILELSKLVDQAKAYAKELMDVLNPFDGDAFNLDNEMANIDEYYNNQTASVKAASDAKISASGKTREAILQDIFAERTASIDSMNAQLAAAQALAQSRLQRPAANDPNVNNNVVPFSPAGSGSSPEGQNAKDQNAEYEKLRLRYATQEEALRINAQNEMTIIAEAMEQKKITEQQGLDLILSARRQHLSQIQALETQKANLILSSSSQIFEGLTSLAGTFAGEQSKAYKVLFAISKGFAIAQGVMNLSTAISNASALPWPTNIPAMAEAAATGASLISNIKGVTLQGQAHEGLERNVREGTWWLRNDEMVLNPQQRRSFEGLVAANEGGQFGGQQSRQIQYRPQISIDATNAVPGMEQRIRTEVEAALTQYHAELEADFANGGPLSQKLSGLAA